MKTDGVSQIKRKAKMNKADRDPKLEYPDQTPVEVPLDLQKAETMDEKIRRILQEQISPKFDRAGYDSFEEANDFDVKDDFEVDEPISRYEMHEMQREFPAEVASPEKEQEPEPDPEKDKPDPEPESLPQSGSEKEN